MKKLFYLLAMALMATTVSYAQNTLVATLSHESEVRMFYGPSALINAVDDAASGDVITLSGGTFGCAKITKGITIRGAGADGQNPTIIGGSNYENRIIDIPSGDSNRLVVEGVRINFGTSNEININAGNLYFIKCDFGLLFDSSFTGEAKFVNCNIGTFSLTGSGNVKLSNCTIGKFTNNQNTTSKADFFNCHLDVSSSTSFYKSSFVNCVLYYSTPGTGYSGSISADASAMNCVYINSGGGTKIDCYDSTVPEVYANYTTATDRWGGTIYYRDGYELSDEAKTTYLGTDGKEVGIYGGQYPFNLTPTYPVITTLNVAKQATADNKLSVEIEVSAAE